MITSLRSKRRFMFRLCLSIMSAGGLATFNSSTAFGQEKPMQLMTWTDSTGKNKTEAEFVKLEGVKLFLRKADGKEVIVTLNRLDDKSRLRARSIAKKGLTSVDTGPLPVLGPPVEFPSNPNINEFKDIVLGEVKKNNYIVFWDALPANKQQQIEELVKLSASKVEQRTFDLIKKFRSEILATLRSKKEFLFKSKALPIPPQELAKLEQAYDPVVELLETMFPENLLDVQNLQDTELRNLVNNYLVNVVTKQKALEPLLPEEIVKQAAAMQAPDDVKIESLSAREALVHQPLPEGMPPGFQPPPTKLILVDGRWLPEEMVKQWDSNIANAKQAIASVDPQVIHRTLGQNLILPRTLLGAFSHAETQEDFDDAIQQIVGLVSSGIPGMSPSGAANTPGQPNGPPGSTLPNPNRKKMPAAASG